MECLFLLFHFEVFTMFIFFSQVLAKFICVPDYGKVYLYFQVLAQMRSTGDVNPGHYSKTIAQVVTSIFLSRSKNQFFNLLKILLLKAHGLTLSCPELYMGLHDTLATAIQVQLAEVYNWQN